MLMRFACRTFEEARPQHLVRHVCGKLGNEGVRRGTGSLRIVRVPLCCRSPALRRQDAPL